jgi:hypothetical protein
MVSWYDDYIVWANKTKPASVFDGECKLPIALTVSLQGTCKCRLVEQLIQAYKCRSQSVYSMRATIFGTSYTRIYLDLFVFWSFA